VWWHWVIVGVVLILVEMSMGTFLFLGIGLAAMVVGGVDYAFHTSFLSELLTWTALSILALAAWVRWFKEPTIVTTGQSDHGLDTEGTVSVAIEPHRRGKVMFDTPVLGNTLWHASSGESIPKGTRVHIVEINGQLIEVTPIKEV
jgi:membrane protein implicated in regulation of membrane protease activity